MEMNMASPLPPVAKSSRAALILMVGLFLLPVLVASGLYLSGWRPAATGNQGELLQPPRPLPEAVLTDAGGKAVRTAELNGRWLMVYVAGSACDAECRGTIDQMRRVHVLLNKEMERVARIALVPGGSPDAALSAAVAVYPDMRLLVSAAGLPMLPVTHGMSGPIYLVSVLLLDAGFLAYAVGLYRNYSDELAKRPSGFPSST